MPDDTFMRRLAFIKYLYSLGVEQSEYPEPREAVSVLSFHDSIELFLQLASEYRNVGAKDLELLEYWDKFEKKSPSISLGQKEGVRRLSRARGGLKHQGILPSRMDIESFRACSTSFFEENTPLVFGIQFADVSMVSLVYSPEARTYLEKADKLVEEGKREDALDQVVMAFTQLVDELESKNEAIRHMPTLSLADRSALSRYHFEGSDKDRLNMLVTEVNDDIRDLREKVAIIGLGLDYSRYLRFRLLTQGIVVWWDSMHMKHIDHLGHLIPVKKQAASADSCRFCIDFVVELALRIQEAEPSVPT